MGEILAKGLIIYYLNFVEARSSLLIFVFYDPALGGVQEVYLQYLKR